MASRKQGRFRNGQPTGNGPRAGLAPAAEWDTASLNLLGQLLPRPPSWAAPKLGAPPTGTAGERGYSRQGEAEG